MADAMRKKVARTLCETLGSMEPGTREEMLDFDSAASAALEACRFEELVTALRVAWNALDSAEAVWTPGDPPEEIDHWVLDPIPYASATSFVLDALKKVEASDA